MDLEPTVTEARLYVGCLWLFWALSAVANANGGTWGVFASPLVIVAVVMVARVLARSTGRSVRDHLGFRGDWHLSWLFLTTMFSARWWKTVVRTTGWPSPLVTLALAGTLVAALVADYAS